MAYTVWEGAAVIGVVRSASSADEALELAKAGKFLTRRKINNYVVADLTVTTYAKHHFN